MTFNAPFRFMPCVIVMLAGLPQTLQTSCACSSVARFFSLPPSFSRCWSSACRFRSRCDSGAIFRCPCRAAGRSATRYASPSAAATQHPTAPVGGASIHQQRFARRQSRHRSRRSGHPAVSRRSLAGFQGRQRGPNFETRPAAERRITGLASCFAFRHRTPPYLLTYCLKAPSISLYLKPKRLRALGNSPPYHWRIVFRSNGGGLRPVVPAICRGGFPNTGKGAGRARWPFIRAFTRSIASGKIWPAQSMRPRQAVTATWLPDAPNRTTIDGRRSAGRSGCPDPRPASPNDGNNGHRHRGYSVVRFASVPTGLPVPADP